MSSLLPPSAAWLVVLRVVGRLTHPPAPLPADMPAWQTRLAGVTQTLLYLVMVALVLLHVAGALLHRFRDRNGVFERMRF